jgi:DNA-binding XRE family transcriptional regulator
VQKVSARRNRPKGYVLTREIPIGILDNKYPVDSKSFGNKLRKLRIDRGLFAKDLAKILAISEDTIFNWERGRTIPVGSNMKRLKVYFPEL